VSVWSTPSLKRKVIPGNTIYGARNILLDSLSSGLGRARNDSLLAIQAISNTKGAGEQEAYALVWRSLRRCSDMLAAARRSTCFDGWICKMLYVSMERNDSLAM
jgi:hypothetical protein